MRAWPMMDEAAASMRRRIEAEPGCRRRDVPHPCPLPDGVEWTNALLSTARHRHAHVETFVAAGRVHVLHVCLFPHLDDATPIFGFDMIAGPSKVTGIFLDLSPVGDGAAGHAGPGLREMVDPAELGRFGEIRTLPDWGSIFSTHMLAVRPADADEVARAIALAERALAGLLAAPPVRGVAQARVAEGQARYIDAQRRNEHTFRMLAGFVGSEAARQFIDDVLFPPVPSDAVPA